MKKLFAIVAMVAVCSFGVTTSVMAQDEQADSIATEQVDSTAAEAENDSVTAEVEAVDEEAAAPAVSEEENSSILKPVKDYFLDGGAVFMAIVALALVLGLALCIERVIYLSLSAINTRAFMAELAKMVAAGKVKEAVQYASSARGPVATVSKKALACLDSDDQNDITTIERTINMEAEVQGTYLEENCSWITLFIALAPSLGFLGTVIGMVESFKEIEAAGDISPTVVAGGMKVALITTIFGIVTAIILQVFYNYILSRVEALTANMEEAAQELPVSYTHLRAHET